jgi:hypothetical protein
MANIPAAQAGVYSATTTWVGGVVPGVGDVAYSNNFTVTVDGTYTLQAISNASGTGITAGGTFVPGNGANLTCTNANGIVQGAVTTSCVTTTGLGTGQSATITASITTTSSSPTFGSIHHSAAGTLAIVTGGVTLTHSGGGGGGVTNSGTGTLNITCSGNLLNNGGANTGAIVTNTSTGTCNIIVAGTVSGGSTNSLGISNGSSGTMIITANLFVGGNSANSAALTNGGSGTLQATGTFQSSAFSPAIGAGSTSQVTRLSGVFLLATGGTIQANNAVSWRWAQGRTPSYVEVPNYSNTAKDNLRTSDNMPTGGYPTVDNVLSTAPVYGDNGQFQGTYVSPTTGSVASGVTYGPSGTLTGTAVLTAAAVRSAIGMGSANLDTQLANKATVDQVAAIVEGATSA